VKPKTIMPFAAGFVILFIFAPRVVSEGLDEHLLLLQPLMGKTWIGHYDGPSDSELEHAIHWAPILGGKVVKSTKQVASLDFSMETFYFWDWEKEAVSFLRLTSRGIFSRGTVSVDEGGVTLLGMGIRPNGVSEFKQTFVIRAGGTLEDYFYRKEDGRWEQGHLIKYAREETITE